MNVHDIGVFRGNILMVCSANVCRSPLAEITVTDAAQSGGLPLRVTSAGIAVRDGATMCHAAARGVPDEPEEHAPRALDAGVVKNSDLILTMERDQRGQVARVAPGSQTRIFTLREAVALLEIVQKRVSAGERERMHSMAEIAAAMHGVRGQLPLLAPSRRRKELHSAPGAWMTIDDGHNGSNSAHAHTIADVRATSLRLTGLLRDVLVESRPAESVTPVSEARRAVA